MTKEENEKLKEKALKQFFSGQSLTGKDGAFSPMLQEFLNKAVEEELSSDDLKDDPKAEDIARQGILANNLEKEIIAMYGLGNSLEDISSYMEDMYATRLSYQVISDVTDRVIPKVTQWQNRSLEPEYAIVWIDAMRFQLTGEGGVENNLLYSILGVNQKGRKKVLGVYSSKGDEGFDFWQEILSNLKSRGLANIAIASTDDFEGLKQAIESVFPRTELQLCVNHQISRAVKFVGAKNKKAFREDLKTVYNAETMKQADSALEDLEEKWGQEYPKATNLWRGNWEQLTCFLKYKAPVRKLIYTTNAAEGYHRGLRKVADTKKVFPSEMALLKLVYLASKRMEKKWHKPVDGWRIVAQELDSHFS